MAKVAKKLPAELEEFLKEVQENISLYPETIVFNRIKDYVTDLSTKQVGWLTSTILISTEFRLRIFKKRCDAGDKLACEMLDLSINGDPYSKNETVRKGLMGLWQIDNDVESGKLLVEIGRITQEDFDKVMRTGKDQETINGKTREQLLCELAAEAMKYPTADAFSMAMIMARLPGLNTAKVYKIIEGKYSSAEDFWVAVQKGEICAGVEKREEIPAPPEKETPPAPPKEKERPRPEPVRAAPEEPIIPVPKKPGGKAPELDLMKQEIEERIASLRAEKARGELKAGEKITDLPYEERRKLAKQIAATYPKREVEGEETLNLDNITELPKEKRIELAKKIAHGEIEIREGVDILTEPKDYSQWTFADFEGLLPGLESVEDLEELYEQVGASEVISDNDKETLRNLIKARIDVVKRFYTEWAIKEVK